MFILNKGDTVLSLKLLFKWLALYDAVAEYENKPDQKGWGLWVFFWQWMLELCNIGQTSSTSVAKGEKNALHYVNKNRGLHVHICQIH